MAIMIIDDSETVREIVKHILKDNGFTDILEAIDGEDGYRKAVENKDRVKLFLVDVNMPNMNGFELIKKLRSENFDKPMIMLTTETDKAKMMRAKVYGATGWIIKPFEEKLFIETIKKFYN